MVVLSQGQLTVHQILQLLPTLREIVLGRKNHFWLRGEILTALQNGSNKIGDNRNSIDIVQLENC